MNRCFVNSDSQQHANAPHGKNDSDCQPEPICPQAEKLPRNLRSERDYTHAEKPCSPAYMCKESYSYSDQENAPTKGVQILIQNISLRH